MRHIVERVKRFTAKYERYIMPATLVLGFIVDYITLNRVDQLLDNLILLGYVVLAATMLYVLYGRSARSTSNLGILIHNIAPFVLQYAVGGLFSGLFIFYFRSGSFTTSFPFLVVLLILMLGNDYFYKRFPKASFQLVVFFIALLAYTNLVVPVVFKSISVVIFAGATTIAAALMYGFVALLSTRSIVLTSEKRKRIHVRLSITLCIFVLLYLANIIPPLPLSLKAGAVGYTIVRQTSGDYTLTVEAPHWYIPFQTYSTRLATTGPVYAFSSIFAPTAFTTNIVHEWSYYDNVEGWVAADRIPLRITGGRDEGFRGYTQKNNLSPGTWRVDVETERGQVIGRMRFTIDPTSTQDTKTLTF